MAVEFACPCGATYQLKDELAGKSVQCPQCRQIGIAGLSSARSIGDVAFDRDKFLLRQKHLSIQEKYELSDEQNQPILYVIRPSHVLRQLAAVFGGMAVGGLVAAVVIFAASSLQDRHETLGGVLLGIGVILGLCVFLTIAVWLAPRRHIFVHRDPDRTELLLQVLQVNKFHVFHGRYELVNQAGEPIARFDKNYLSSIFRKRWDCTGPDGNLLFQAKEDSVILSLLRRVLGPFFGLLRTNFIFVLPNSETVIGEFNRKFTLIDRYVLDLSKDPQRRLDRRIAVAMGVLLDTGERR